MILTLNLATETGTPGWINLEPPAKAVYFRTATNENIKAYLGNIQDNGLPKGYAVNMKALNKQPWQFAKPLTLKADGFTIQAKDGHQYHQQLPVDKQLSFRGIAHEGDVYAFMVVERSADTRFFYYPVLANRK